MPKTKTVQQEVIAALKIVGVATKKDLKNHATHSEVRKIVVEATDAILVGVDKMLQTLVTKEEFNTRLKKVDNELAEIKSDIHFIKDDIKNIEADISVLPSRSEFNKLKAQVDLIS